MPSSPRGDRNGSEIDWFSHEDTEDMQDKQDENAQCNQGSRTQQQTNQLAAALFDNPSADTMSPLVMMVMQSRTEHPLLGRGGVQRYTPVPQEPLTVQPRSALGGSAATAVPSSAPKRKRKRSRSPSAEHKRQRAHSEPPKFGVLEVELNGDGPWPSTKDLGAECLRMAEQMFARRGGEPVGSPDPESKSKRAQSEPAVKG